ncbi:MAG: type II toxin-antitoxin system PemK/MazF family toxin [Simkania sp.]|nr:type II toxin-antitoxin system PemK/MazF family toxin [Simkania sp.]
MALQALSKYCSAAFSRPSLMSRESCLFGFHLTISRPFSTGFTTNLTRGDIVLYRGKFEGETGDVLHSKDRPHIVISSNKVLEVTKRVAVAPLSTAARRYEYEVMIPSNDQTGIDKTSKVVANQIRTGYLEEGFIKIGSAAGFLPIINQALMTCFGDIRIDKEVEIARGDVVEIDFGKFRRSGIIVSNDIGNHFSQIAMLAHTHHQGEVTNEFDLLVKREGSSQDKLLVQCYMINTFAQGFMDKAGRISEEDMEKVTKMLFKTLGLDK